MPNIITVILMFLMVYIMINDIYSIVKGEKPLQNVSSKDELLNAGWYCSGGYWTFEDSRCMDFLEALQLHRSYTVKQHKRKVE